MKRGRKEGGGGKGINAAAIQNWYPTLPVQLHTVGGGVTMGNTQAEAVGHG